MSDDPDNSLEKRLEAARKEFNEDYNPPANDKGENMSVGARAGVELIGSLIGGGLIGFLLDKWLDTSPILFLIFLILGIVTGFYNVYKITSDLGTSVGVKGLHSTKKDATQSPDLKNQNKK